MTMRYVQFFEKKQQFCHCCQQGQEATAARVGAQLGMLRPFSRFEPFFVELTFFHFDLPKM
jgi:hypothetical protein